MSPTNFIRWVSHATVSFIFQYLCKTNLLNDVGMDIFLETFRFGIRKIALTPTFLTFLVLRQFWFDHGLPLFIIHRYYHDNFFHIK